MTKRSGIVSGYNPDKHPETEKSSLSQISVIVPVYKAEKYLDRCIYSIINQTYTNFELILIDDGSPDSCGIICDKWKDKDNRIKVIHQDNRGVSAARNAGIKLAKGQFVTFCDADDEMLPDCLKTYMSYSKETDLVIISHQAVNESGKVVRRTIHNRRDDVLVNKDIVLELLGGKELLVVWDKRFKRSILIDKSITFDISIDLSEDTLFVVQYLHFSKMISVDNQINYQYQCSNENSISRFDKRFMYDRALPAELKIASVLQNKYAEINNSFQWKSRVWGICYDTIFGILQSTDLSFTQKSKELGRIFHTEMFKCLKPDVETLARTDGKRIKLLLQTAKPTLLLIYWWCSQRKKAAFHERSCK